MSEPPAVSKVRRGFLASVIALSSGAVGAQLLNFVSAPLISRIFSPESIGVSVLFLSIAMVLWVLACARYDVALMLPREDERAANVFALCLLLPMIFAAVLAALVPLLRTVPLFQEGRWSPLAPFLSLFPLLVWSGGWTLALRAWSARHNRFGRLGVSRISASAAYGGGAVIGGLSGLVGPGMLIAARVLQPIAEVLVLGVNVLRQDMRFLRANITLQGMRKEAITWRKFPGVETFSTFISATTAEIPVILLGLYFAREVLGYYGYAVLVLLLPMRFAGEAIRDVFFQRSSTQAAAGENLAPMVEAVLHRLIGLALLPMGLVAIAGPTYFAFVFGEPWAQSGEYARLLAPFLFFLVLTAPLSNLFSTLQRQGSALAYTIFNLVTRGGVLVYGGLVLQDPDQALLLYSLVGAAGSALLLLVFMHWTGARISRVFRGFLLNLVAATPVWLLVFWVQHSLQPGAGMLTVFSAGAMLLFPVLLYATDPSFRNLVANHRNSR